MAGMRCQHGERQCWHAGVCAMCLLRRARDGASECAGLLLAVDLPLFPTPPPPPITQPQTSAAEAAAAAAQPKQERQPQDEPQQQQPQPQQPGGGGAIAQHARVFAAVVLERLPLVQSPPPEWEAEYKEWATELAIKRGKFKEYPAAERKAGAKAKDEGAVRESIKRGLGGGGGKEGEGRRAAAMRWPAALARQGRAGQRGRRSVLAALRRAGAGLII